MLALFTWVHILWQTMHEIEMDLWENNKELFLSDQMSQLVDVEDDL